ncbi:MAG: hypothetical protein HQK62_00590 [Desulfamplus sp.]|nr:hypothetical protein [Desulfamplus sp.]MBF0257330.1 hypothetical protein [Desulfamplus sp.]
MKNGFAVVILFSLLFSCGYTLQGGGKLPGNIETVSVAVFKNKSAQVGAETLFANALIQELMRNSTVRVIDHKSEESQNNNDADALIYGTIVSVSFNALARTSEDSVYKRGVSAVIDLEMKSSAGEILFAVNGFTESESYAVANDNATDEAILNSTIEKIASRLSRRLVGQMTDSF